MALRPRLATRSANSCRRGQGCGAHTRASNVDGAVREVEALLDQQRQLADAAAVLAQHIGCARGVDDDLRARGRGADLEAGVSARGGGDGTVGWARVDSCAKAQQGPNKSASGHQQRQQRRHKPVLGQLAGEQLVQLGLEDAVGNELGCRGERAQHVLAGAAPCASWRFAWEPSRQPSDRERIKQCW